METRPIYHAQTYSKRWHANPERSEVGRARSSVIEVAATGDGIDHTKEWKYRNDVAL